MMRVCNFLFAFSNRGNKIFLSSEVNSQILIACFFFVCLFRKRIIELQCFRVATVGAI